MCLCEISHGLATDFENSHWQVGTSKGPTIDHSESPFKLELSRLDALDHADALPRWAEKETPHGHDWETNRLETVFDAAARLLAQDDHNRQELAFEISRRSIEILIMAHRAQADSTENKHIESIYLDHASQLQEHLATPVSSGEASYCADA